MAIISSSLPCYGAANCFAHTSAYNVGHGFANGSGAISSPTMNTTGATLLVAVMASYSGYNQVLNDSVGTRDWNTTAMFGGGAGSNLMILYKQAPVTSTNYTFSIPDTGGANLSYMSATVWACSGTAIDLYILTQQVGVDTSSGSTLQPGAVTPLEAGDLVFTAVTANQHGLTATIDSGYPAPFIYNPTGPYLANVSTWQAAPNTTPINPTWTTGYSPMQAVQVVFRVAGTSPPTSTGQFIKTVVGTGFEGYGGMGGPALNSYIDYPGEIVKLSNGLICFAAVQNNIIECYNPTGGILTPPYLGSPAIAPGNVDKIAGNGTLGFVDGVAPLSAEFAHPVGMAVDSSDCMYIADQQNAAIRKMCPGGNVTTIVGRGTNTGLTSANCRTPSVTDGWNGFLGDGGPASASSIDCPQSVALDSARNIAFGDFNNNRVRVVNTQSTTQTIAGVSVCAGCIQTVFGQGTHACIPASTGTAWAVESPLGVAFDTSGNIIVGGYPCHQIFKVDTSNHVTVVAGNGTAGWAGDGGLAVNAELHYPFRADVDTNGDIYIADTTNQAIRLVKASTGIITTIAGNPTIYPYSSNPFHGGAYCCDGGWANLAALGYPIGLLLDNANHLIYESDLTNSRLRVLYPSTLAPAGSQIAGKTKWVAGTLIK